MERYTICQSKLSIFNLSFLLKRMPVNNGPSGPDARPIVVGDQRVATAAIKSRI